MPQPLKTGIGLVPREDLSLIYRYIAPSHLSQELGFRGEVGYQTFLYSNESDIRRVFMFLVEKLPKAETEATETVMGMKHMHLPVCLLFVFCKVL